MRPTPASRIGAPCTFIPPFLLERVAASHEDPHVSRSGARTLVIDEQVRAERLRAIEPVPASGTGPPATATAAAWDIHDAHNGSSLPGDLVRGPGDPTTSDLAVDEAATSTQATLDFFATVLRRTSYDDHGAPVVVSVHYQQGYDNAFWNGQQLVFGDGDASVFDRFTKPVDVLAHEFGHAVTQFTARLNYQGQSGALNESMSDVFGIQVKQRLLGQTAAQADWLIGEGIFLPAVQGKALRSMKEPGSAYNDDVLGKDPQVGSMKDYVDTTDDNGGVHTNSGIANRAFYLAATALGGNAWDEAGPIWYAALTGGDVAASTDFAGFAAATIAAATARHGTGSGQVTGVAQAWSQVGVTPTAVPPAVPGTGQSPGTGPVIEVRRSGGFAGRTISAVVDSQDPRRDELLGLLQRSGFDTWLPSPAQPDRFVYAFVVDGREVHVQEQDLAGDVRRLADLVLGLDS